MLMDGVCSWKYATRYRIKRLSAVCGWVKRWIHWGRCGTVLHRDVATFANIHFISCSEEETYASVLALIGQNGSESTVASSTTHSLKYVAFLCRYDSLQLLVNFEYGSKETRFEHRFSVKRHAPFFNCQCVDVFGIPKHDEGKFFLHVPSWLSG